MHMLLLQNSKLERIIASRWIHKKIWTAIKHKQTWSVRRTAFIKCELSPSNLGIGAWKLEHWRLVVRIKFQIFRNCSDACTHAANLRDSFTFIIHHHALLNKKITRNGNFTCRTTKNVCICTGFKFPFKSGLSHHFFNGAEGLASVKINTITAKIVKNTIHMIILTIMAKIVKKYRYHKYNEKF